MLTRSNSEKGSVFIEAAIVFPLIIAIIAMIITVSFKLYTALKDNSIKHKEDIKKSYEIYEKSRLLISIHSADIFIDNEFFGDYYRNQHGQSC